MKKSLLAAVITVEILAGSVCSAEISQNKLELGGVQYGATISDVEKNLGKPRKSKTENKFYGEKTEYEYNRSMEIKFLDGKVVEIEIDDHSDAKTSGGIGIGADVAEIENVYGTPDFIYRNNYIYKTNDQNLGLAFKIKNGVVKKITCGVLEW